MKNILRLTKHNLEVKRLQNFRKKLIYSQEKTYSDLTIVSRTNGVLSSTEVSSALHFTNHHGPVWYMCLKTKNCCLNFFVEIRVGEKVCENT